VLVETKPRRQSEEVEVALVQKVHMPLQTGLSSSNEPTVRP